MNRCEGDFLMKISEIPINAVIQIRVVRGKKKFECLAVVVATREHELFLAPIKYEGQLVDFSAQNIQIFAFYVNEKRQAFGWSACRIRKDTYMGKRCHRLATKHDSVRVNRREEPRIRTDLNAIIRTATDDKELEVVVRNYSQNGIGFVCAKKISERDWPLATLVYEDHAQQLHVPLHLNILRCIELPNGMYKYGCIINQPEQEWLDYVEGKLEAIREHQAETGQTPYGQLTNAR